MSNPTESIQNSFAIVAFSRNVIRNGLRNEIIETLLVDLYPFIKFLKIKISAVPKIVQSFPFIWLCRVLFRHELFLNCSWWRLQFHWWNLCQQVFIVFSQKNKFPFAVFKDWKIIPLFFLTVYDFFGHFTQIYCFSDSLSLFFWTVINFMYKWPTFMISSLSWGLIGKTWIIRKVNKCIMNFVRQMRWEIESIFSWHFVLFGAWTIW